MSHGWKPESGFITYNWDSYSECLLLYLLGLGAKNGLPAEAWTAWTRGSYKYGGWEAFAGGPIFLHEMPYAYFDLRGKRDAAGYDYWQRATNGVRINRQFCIDNPSKRKTYASDVWGLNASDGPKGYNAYGVPGPEDGTVSPTGALASIIFDSAMAKAAGRAMYEQYGEKIWGHYGFADAFNADADWYDTDVIGIDLGMALLAIEDYRTGLIWKLVSELPSTRKAYQTAGLAGGR